LNNNSGRLWRRLIQCAIALALLLAVTIAVFYRREIYDHFHHPLHFRAEVEQAVEGTLVSPPLMMALIRTESSFNPQAVSSAGARGLTQIMPDTFDWLQTRTGSNLPQEALFEPEISIRYGVLFMDILLAEFGVTETALAAYHAGRGQVNRWLRDPETSPDGRTIEHIPTPQTRHYVYKVMNAYARYQRILRP